MVENQGGLMDAERLVIETGKQPQDVKHGETPFGGIQAVGKHTHTFQVIFEENTAVLRHRSQK